MNFLYRGNGPRFRAHVKGDPCAYCGEPADVLDHIVPESQYGPNGWENLTAACSLCNTRKSGRSLLGYLGYRRLREATDAVVEPILAERGDWGRLGGRRRPKGWRR